MLPVLPVLVSASQVDGGGAVIWTDKQDYSPEETVTMYGSVFKAGAHVAVSVTRPNGHVDEWGVLSDRYGAFTTKYQLDGITGTYAVTATDGTNRASTTFTDKGLGYDFYGWDMVSNSWTKGNLAGWFEGDLVRYQLVVSGDVGATVPILDIVYDFYGPNAILVDYLTDFKWGTTDFSGGPPYSSDPPAGFASFTPPVLTAPTTTPDTCASPAQFRYFEIRPGEGGVPSTIPSSRTLVFYYRAHLARSIVWLNLLEKNFPIITQQISWASTCTTPHTGASGFPGASPHFTLDVPGVGKKAIPIPVPTPPAGTISGHKWNDVNINGKYDSGIDKPIQGWEISCSGTVDDVSVTFYTTTGSDGSYSFTLLTDGTWTISETIQSGWTPTPGTLTSIPITLPLPAGSPYGTAGSRTASNVDFFNYYIIPSTTITLLSASTITLGQSVTDTATVTGAGPTPTGTVDFQVSTDSGATWNKFGATKTLVSGSATSDSYTPMAVGHYDFRSVYSGDSKYLGSTSTNPEPLDVGPATPGVITELSSSSITLGDSVTDMVTVTGLGDGFPGPTGTVDFQVSTDSGATWNKFGATKTLVSGSATSDSYTPMAAGDYYFRAVYSGDSNYAGKTSTNEEKLTVGPADSTTATLLSKSPITLGESVTDKATVTGLGGSFPMPTGNVEFYVSTDGGTTWAKFGATKTLDSSGKATSDSYKPLATGTYYFKAKYLGDTNYPPSESGATEEPLKVKPYTPTAVTEIHDGDHNVVTSVPFGSSVHDKATVTGIVGFTPPDSTKVTFKFYSDGACGIVSSSPANVGADPTGGVMSATVGPLTTGLYSFKAFFEGDSNYAAAESACEPLEVGAGVGTIRTELSANSITLGESVSDTAILEGVTEVPPAGGTITFKVFTTANCSGEPVYTSDAMNVYGPGKYGPSTPLFTPTAVGIYQWQAFYSGDLNNAALTDTCGNEPLEVRSGEGQPPVGGELYEPNKLVLLKPYLTLLGLLAAIATAVAITRGRRP
jgi:hypothetical protein